MLCFDVFEQPTAPTQPTQPTEPTTPTQPTQPTMPELPTMPTTVTTFGFSFNWLAIALIAAVSIAVSYFALKRRRQK